MSVTSSVGVCLPLTSANRYCLLESTSPVRQSPSPGPSGPKFRTETVSVGHTGTRPQKGRDSEPND